METAIVDRIFINLNSYGDTDTTLYSSINKSGGIPVNLYTFGYNPVNVTYGG